MKSGIVASNGLIDSQSKMDIKDYLHLYLGCKVQVTLYLADVPDKTKIGTLIGSYIDQWENGQYYPTVQVDFGFHNDRKYYRTDWIKPILRPLSSMTEEEKNEYSKIDRKFTSDNILPEIKAGRLIVHHHSRKSVELTRYLLSKGFDLFNLIENNLAISSHA